MLVYKGVYDLRYAIELFQQVLRSKRHFQLFLTKILIIDQDPTKILKDLAIKKTILQKLFLSARALVNLKLTGN